MWHALGVVVECVRNREACDSAAQALRFHLRTIFWNLLPAPVIGGETYRQIPVAAGECFTMKELFHAKIEPKQLRELELNAEGRDGREQSAKHLDVSRPEWTLCRKSDQHNVRIPIPLRHWWTRRKAGTHRTWRNLWATRSLFVDLDQSFEWQRPKEYWVISEIRTRVPLFKAVHLAERARNLAYYEWHGIAVYCNMGSRVVHCIYEN